MSNTQPISIHRGIVKQIVSGDALIIRGQPRGGPPPEKQVNLSNIIAPKLARRASPTAEKQQDIKDEPYAWEAREFLRKKLIGKEVCFLLDYKAPNGNREYGIIYLGKDTSGENINEAIIAEGLAEVRQSGAKPNEALQKLLELQEAAKSAKKGKWAQDDQDHIRDVKWTVDSPRNFVDSLHQKPMNAVIEHVRDGSTVRAVLLPDFYYITVMLSGIRCPTFKQGDDNQSVPDPYALEAKFFTESRLLHRDVEIILESVSNQNFLGTVLHPNGNIAELLLKEGMARCVDWSITLVSTGTEKLRSAERMAKEKRLRIWKDYAPSGPTVNAKDREYQGKVMEVNNADSLVIKCNDGTLKKIFLASIRPPRLSEEKSDNKNRTFRPLYDIPYMYEAREFLRKKLIAKKVNVTVDYIQPATNAFPEKSCCTVTIGGANVAEALISKGLATVVRYRQDDDKRSAHYDELLAAEGKAQKSGKGLHSKKEQPVHRVVDLCGDLSKSKQFFPFLQRAGRMDAVVEFVASGSRLRLYVPRENCIITFLLAGINCPKAKRPGQGGTIIEGELWGEEALHYTKELCLQREVSVEVESMDKAGNFIGWLWIENTNLSVALVQEGLASVHFTAENSPHARTLQIAETDAKKKKDKLWSNYEEQKEPEIIDDVERKVNYKSIVITEVNDDLSFYAQNVDDGKQLEEITDKLRQDMANNPPLPGAYNPKKGDLCAANFVDGQWYRAKIDKVSGKVVHISYIDYGNKEITDISKLASLPSTFHGFPGAATHYGLACVKLPKDTEVLEDARLALKQDTENNRILLLNVEYRQLGIDYITLLSSEDKEDIVKNLIAEGLLLADERREKRLQKVVGDYKAAEQIARRKRMNLWRYGDFDDDDAVEFGYKP